MQWVDPGHDNSLALKTRPNVVKLWAILPAWATILLPLDGPQVWHPHSLRLADLVRGGYSRIVAITFNSEVLPQGKVFFSGDMLQERISL
eukprot:7715035-Pyramimonas_sp.AAC.1